MIGYGPAAEAIRAERGLPYATGADEPPEWHDHPGMTGPDDQPGAQPETRVSGMTTINVTREHIARGVQEDCERCPVALAIMDALPGAPVPSVGPSDVTFRVGIDTWADIVLPPEAVAFIETFDGGTAGVEPFTFDLDYPAAVAA